MHDSIVKVSTDSQSHVDSPRYVLIVEDDETVSRLLASLVSSMGFRAVQVSSAREAGEFLKKLTPDLILLDLRLPGQSGDDWLIAFRRRVVSTPVIVISGVEDINRRVAVLPSGANDFVAKPFQLVELQAHITALLRRPTNLASRRICGGAVLLDPVRPELRLGDVSQSLTTREFGIMWFLVAHEEIWVEPSQLSKSVLGGATKADVECLRVHLCNLRDKLAPFEDHFKLETKRDFGYRIVHCDTNDA